MRSLFAPVLVLGLFCSFGVSAENSSLNLIASTSGVISGTNPGITIRKQVEEVRITFHATDRQQRPVLNLPDDAVIVTDNGVPVNKTSGLHTTSDLPLSIALMIDASDSVSRDFAAEREASNELIRSLIQTNDDRVLLVAFRETIDLTQRMTGDPREVEASMRKIKTGGLTALYDAVVRTSHRLTDSDSSAGRRAIILISDGEDTDSHYLLSDAVAAAVRDDVAVYTVTVRTKQPSQRGEQTLRLFSEATGGRSFVVRGSEDLNRALHEIENDLRTQYFVTYRPAAIKSGFHTLKVTSNSKEVSIRARAGYFVRDAN